MNEDTNSLPRQRFRGFTHFGQKRLLRQGAYVEDQYANRNF